MFSFTFIKSTKILERLVGLALLNIHTNIAVNPKKLADEFMSQIGRRKC